MSTVPSPAETPQQTPPARTIFQKIAAREIPAQFVHEDGLCFAIRDISPQAPVHILVIPKQLVARVEQAGAGDAPLLGHLLLTAGKIAREQGLSDGFRLVVNNGRQAGETVPHLHVHLLGGRDFAWPPG
ncbi:MAG: histidine triad nucleotide-binding protein [Puniceicoccales bacterium]|jgi:histidine triad (HIT) family protein|nr:histidine triad nucleotide-binding protein [Puniceicoccales bacterium]